MKALQHIFVIMLFSQISFSQDSTTIQPTDKKLIIQKLPAVLERIKPHFEILNPNFKMPLASGQPGGNINIRLCCCGNGRPPLYVIDGKEMIDSVLNKLKPDEIESIIVLSDLKATEKYGEKAKDGVIIITTKKK